MGLYDFTIYSIIKRNARVYGNRVALASAGKKLSYKQFLEKVDALAYGLMEAGVEKGDRIGILAQNSLEFIFLLGAAAKIGAIMLTMNWRLTEEEIEYIISDASPKVIVAGSEFKTMINPLISKFNFIEKCYSMGEADEVFLAFNDLMKNNGVCPELDVHSDDSYVMVYLAAVGGKPRGAILSQIGLIAGNLQSMYRFRLTEKDSNLCMLPLFHIAGLFISLAVIQAGGLNIIIQKFDVDLALKHIQEDKVTLFGEFQPMLTNLLDKAEEYNYDISSLRFVFGLESPDTAKRFEEMTKATFWSVYGQTETSGMVTFAPYFERPGSAGIPMFYG